MAVIMTVKTSTCSKYFCPPTCSYRCFFIPATCVTSHKSMSFTVLGVEDGDGDYYDGDESKQAASDFNFGHFL